MLNGERLPAEAVLHDMWHEMCDDASRPAKCFVEGAIELAYCCGLINLEQRELWERRIETCPGHDGGGRVWCAYCGDLPDEAAQHRLERARGSGGT